MRKDRTELKAYALAALIMLGVLALAGAFVYFVVIVPAG